MTDLDTLARTAAQELVARTVPDVAARYADVRRMRTRRSAAKLVAAVAATGLVLGTWQLGQDDADDVQPVAPVHLVLTDARLSSTDFLADVRTEQRGEDLDHDRFDGITDDGLVVRSRYTYDADVSEYGLLDPESGVTDWLPRPPWDLGDPTPLRLTSEFLVFLDRRHLERFDVLTFDRGRQRWQRVTFARPDDVDRFFGFTAVLGNDRRVYLMDPVPQVRWYSVGADGGEPRLEPDLEGQTLAFTDTARITADGTGRVLVHRAGGDDPQVVTEGLPDGCKLEPGSHPQVALAGDRPVVSYPCSSRTVVAVYEPSGAPYVELTGDVLVGGAGPRHLLLTDPEATYSLNLERRELHRIDAGNSGGFAGGRDVVGDLALWAVDADHDPDVFSLAYWVGRLP